MSDFEIGDGRQRVPLHLMQQGGVTPIDPPVFGLGETAPMLLQAASQPIDSGVQAVVQLSRISQRRNEQQFRAYSFEIERDMQERNIDLQREMFEWKKLSWEMEFDEGLKQQARNNILLMDQMMTGYSQGNPQTMGSRSGASRGTENFNNPGQVAAANAAEQKARPAYDALQELVVGDVREDPGGMRRHSNEYKKAYTSDEYIAAENQRMLYAQQMAQWKTDPEKYDTGLAEYGQQKYMQEEDVNVAPDMLYVSPKAMIDEVAKAYEDRYDLPQMHAMNYGFYQAIKENYGMGEEVVQALKSDPSGTYKALYTMEFDKGRIPEGMDYESWLDTRVRNDLTMYDPTRGYEEIGTPQQQKAGDGSGSSARWHGEGPTGRRTTYVSETDITRPKGPALDRINKGGRTLSITDSANGLEYVGGLGDDIGLGGDVPIRTGYPSPTGRSDVRIKKDSKTDGNEYLKYIIHDQNGVSLNEIDMEEYVDSDGFLTQEAADMLKSYNKKESLQQTPIVHHYDPDIPRKDKNNKTELEYYNQIYDPVTGKVEQPFMDIETGEMFTQGEMQEWLGKSSDYGYVGYIDANNIYSMLADQNNDGVISTESYGVEPMHLQAKNDQGEFRKFIVPQDIETLLQPEWQVKAAIHRTYAQATAGKGNVIPIAWSEEEKQSTIGQIMRVQTQYMPPREASDMTERIASSVIGIELVDDGNGKAIGKRYYFNGEGGRGDGEIVVLNSEYEPLALAVADAYRKNLGKGDNFEIVQYYDPNAGIPYFQIKINGEAEEDLFPIPDANGYIDDKAFNDKIERSAKFAGKPFTELTIQENGRINGLVGMVLLPEGTTLIPKFHKRFLGEFRVLDSMIAGAGLNYTFTSMFREGSKAHDGRAVDMRYRPETSLDEFFKSNNPEFKPSESGKFNPYKILGTNLSVAKHDNRDSDGQHYHVFMNPDPKYIPEIVPGLPSGGPQPR